MYAQELLLNDHTDKQGTGTSEENKFQLQIVLGTKELQY